MPNTPEYEIKLVREGAIPLHVQLLNQLRHLVLSGRWPADTRVPSEPELQRSLNVSRGTIRQALNNAEAEGLITRVPGKGTFVTALASGGRSGRLVGYVTGNCSGPMQSQILSGAESVVAAQGYRIIFGNSNGNVDEEDRILDQLVLEDGVAGVLAWPVMRQHRSGRLFDLCRQGAVPLVVVDRTLPGLACDFVASQNYAGAREAVEHLVSLGHRHIVFLSQPILQLVSVAERLRGYRDGLQASGLKPCEPWLVGSAAKEMDVKDVLEGLADTHAREIEGIVGHLGSGPPPTAILAINDTMAIQAIEAARMVGLQVPRDLSVVGFDDVMAINALLDVPLTTVAQDAYAMGKRAAGLLIERVQGYDGAPREELLPTRLRVRASTGPVV